MSGSVSGLNFHGEDVRPSPPGAARFEVIPVPYEKTVSYRPGTAAGPLAILAASTQLELFDGIDIPAAAGIYTHPFLDCRPDENTVLKTLEEVVAAVLERGACPVVLGGEHSLTLAAARALRRYHPDCGIIQFDAHADLRDRYQDNPLSHACVMRRVHELGLPIFQIGTRSYAREEHQFRRQAGIAFVDAATVYRQGAEAARPPADFPNKIFITIDIDGFDPALVPATGTPVPGGLSWYQVIDILALIAARHQIIGFDLVELAPLAESPVSDFTAAQLIYNLMGLINRRPRA